MAPFRRPESRTPRRCGAFYARNGSRSAAAVFLGLVGGFVEDEAEAHGGGLGVVELAEPGAGVGPEPVGLPRGGRQVLKGMRSLGFAVRCSVALAQPISTALRTRTAESEARRIHGTLGTQGAPSIHLRLNGSALRPSRLQPWRAL